MSTRRGRAAAALLAGTMLAFATATTAVAQVQDPPPDTTIDTGPSGTVTDPSATFTFSGTGANFECSLDGQAYGPCASPKHYADLADGTHHFDVRAVSAGGIPDDTPAYRDWMVNRPDTTPPDTDILSGPSGSVEETSATFTFSSNESNVTFECAKDTGAFLACTSPKTYWGFNDGAHSFRVRAIDRADNPDPTPAARDWTVRQPTTTSQPPTTPTTAPPSTNTTTPPGETTTTSPPAGGGGIFLPPVKPNNAKDKPTTTTGKPGKGGTSTSTSTSTAATETTVPAGPVADPPGALVLSGRQDSGSGDFTAAAPKGAGPVVGEVNKRRRNTGAMIGFAVALGILLLGTGSVLWWRRPGRYIPA